MSLSKLFNKWQFRDAGTGRLDIPFINNIGLQSTFDLFLDNRFSVLRNDSNPLTLPAIPNKQYIITFISLSVSKGGTPDENIRLLINSSKSSISIGVAVSTITGRSQTISYEDQFLPMGKGLSVRIILLGGINDKANIYGFIQ